MPFPSLSLPLADEKTQQKKKTGGHGYCRAAGPAEYLAFALETLRNYSNQSLPEVRLASASGAGQGALEFPAVAKTFPPHRACEAAVPRPRGGMYTLSVKGRE